jgi:hypothetical protein
LHRVVLVVHGVVLGGRGGVESIKRQQQMEKIKLGVWGEKLIKWVARSGLVSSLPS